MYLKDGVRYIDDSELTDDHKEMWPKALPAAKMVMLLEKKPVTAYMRDVLKEEDFTDFGKEAIADVWAIKQIGGRLEAVARRINPEAMELADEIFKDEPSAVPKGQFETKPNFYSQLSQRVDGLKQLKGNGNQMLNMIKKSGVKAEELRDTGLEEWLKDQPSVTKQEIIDYLDGKKVVLKLHEFGGREQPGEPTYIDWWDKDNIPSEYRSISVDFTNDKTVRFGVTRRGTYYSIDKLGPTQYVLRYEEDEDGISFNSMEMAEDSALHDAAEAEDDNPAEEIATGKEAKFTSYISNFPGFENPREILITLPKPTPESRVVAEPGPGHKVRVGDAVMTWEDAFRKYVDDPEIKIKTYKKVLDKHNVAYQQTIVEEDIIPEIRVAIGYDEADYDGSRVFAVPSAHQYDDAADVNQVVRIITNDREVLVDDFTVTVSGGALAKGQRGSKVTLKSKEEKDEFLKVKAAGGFTTSVEQRGASTFHIDENQSDWHQAGRKQGYRVTQEKEGELPPDYRVTMRLGSYVIESKVINAVTLDDVVSTLDGSEKWYAIGTAGTEKGAIKDAWKYYNENNPIPDAPFKDSWAMLGFKQALQIAVDEQYEYVSWSPAEIVQDRYDLSKVVESIEWQETEGSKYRLWVNAKGGGQETFRDISPDKLDEYIPKEAAEKITSSPDDAGVLKDLDLKVGGEWATNLYDKYLPREVGKYIKKLDKNAKVEVVKVGKEYTSSRIAEGEGWRYPDGKHIIRKVEEGNYVVEEGEARIEYFDDADSAIEYLDKLTGMDGKSSDTQDIWAVKITDAIEDAISQGQPLYEQRENIKPEFSNPDTIEAYVLQKKIMIRLAGIHQQMEMEKAKGNVKPV
jgi:hypothetical protein